MHQKEKDSKRRSPGGQSEDGGLTGPRGMARGSSPLLDQGSVHSEAQHGEHSGADARPQPKRGVLQVGLCHVSAEGKVVLDFQR